MGSKSANILDRRVKFNPRYAHVTSVVDTGASLPKYLKMLDQLKLNYKFRKDEIFKRIRLSAFVTLLIEVERVKLVQSPPIDTPQVKRVELEDSRSGAGDGANKAKGVSRRRARTALSSRSTLHSLVNGIGEIDEDAEEDAASQVASSIDLGDASVPPLVGLRPYALLDVRTADEYNECHIVTASNYPSAMLSRSMDYESKELRENKNKPGTIIILYDEDETNAPRVATTLVQRGYENIFMLSGGLRLAINLFPQGLVTGDPSPILREAGSKQLMVTGRSSCLRTNRSIASSSASSFGRINPSSTSFARLTDAGQGFDEYNLAMLENQLEDLARTKGVPEYVSARFTPRSTTSVVGTSRVSSGISCDRSSVSSCKSRPWR